MRLLLAAVLLAGATPLPAQSPPPFPHPPRPTWSREPVPLKDRRVPESSGVVVSRRQPGILWTFNDSGNPAEIFATDTAGTALGRWRVIGARNRDWEAMTLGPGPCPGGTCLYIGDIGDNSAAYPTVRIYRLAEPVAGAGRNDSFAVNGILTLRYPDGPHDAESLFADGSGDLYIITKPRVARPEVFRIPAAAWRQHDTVVAQLTDSLAIDPRTGVETWVTDAATSPDGKTVAVRTYAYLYLYHLTPDGHLQPASTTPICDLTGLGPQGEGIGWLDGHTFVLTSERFLLFPASVAVVRCGG